MWLQCGRPQIMWKIIPQMWCIKSKKLLHGVQWRKSGGWPAVDDLRRLHASRDRRRSKTYSAVCRQAVVFCNHRRPERRPEDGSEMLDELQTFYCFFLGSVRPKEIKMESMRARAWREREREAIFNFLLAMAKKIPREHDEAKMKHLHNRAGVDLCHWKIDEFSQELPGCPDQSAIIYKNGTEIPYVKWTCEQKTKIARALVCRRCDIVTPPSSQWITITLKMSPRGRASHPAPAINQK